MKALVFDASPIISLAMNNLLWLLEPLKENFGGSFYIPESVRGELIDKPLATKRFRFEAMQILKLVADGVIGVVGQGRIEQQAVGILSLANHCFSAKGNYIQIVHHGEVSSIAAALYLGTTNLVIDERTTRELVERPEKIAYLLGNKLHTKISINRENLRRVRELLRNFNVIRSSELVAVSFEAGLLDRYLYKGEESVLKEPRKALIEAALWGVKLNGCAISKKEIETITRIER